MSLLITVDVHTYETREPDPEDSWDRGDTRGEVRDVVVHFDHYPADKVGWRSHSFESEAQPGDFVYVVVADYETGDTFGRRGGQYDIIDVFTDHQEAYRLASAAESVPRGEFQFDFSGKQYYASWTGYFEYLNEIRVWQVTVQ